MGNQKLCASNISWIASIVKSWIIISSHSLRSRNVDETDQVWVACISEYLITLYLVKLWQYLTIPHLHTHNIKINIKHAEEAGAFIHETLGEAGDDVMSGLGLWLYLESLLTLAGPVSIPTSRPWALLQLSSPGPAWQNIWVPRRYYQSGGVSPGKIDIMQQTIWNSHNPQQNTFLCVTEWEHINNLFKMSASSGKKNRTFPEKVKFYVTFTAASVAIFTFSLFLFLIPFVIDPTVATINQDFIEQPVQCRVVLNKYILGECVVTRIVWFNSSILTNDIEHWTHGTELLNY